MEETITIRREEYRTLIEGNEKLQVIKRLAADTDSIYSSNILRIIGGLKNDRNNVDLYLEKIGEKQSQDISDKPQVKFGIAAEPIIRELFQINYPQMQMNYIENNNFINDKYPFARASLDGWLTDQDGINGIWECKTSQIVSSAVKEKWNDQVPDNYYCQILHYFLVREDCDFAILTALLTWDYSEKEPYQQLRNYRFER